MSSIDPVTQIPPSPAAIERGTNRSEVMWSILPVRRSTLKTRRSAASPSTHSAPSPIAMSRIVNLAFPAVRGVWNGTSTLRMTRIRPASGRNSVEVRATRGPQDTAPSGDGASEDVDPGFPRTRDGVVPRHDPLERSLPVARHKDLSAQRRDVAWLACRREPRQIPRRGIEAPEGAVPEIARPDSVGARRDRTRVGGDRVGRDHPVRRRVNAEQPRRPTRPRHHRLSRTRRPR